MDAGGAVNAPDRTPGRAARDAGVADDLLAVLDRSAAGVVVTDAHGSIRFANRGAAELLDRSGDDLVGMDLWRLVGSRPTGSAAAEWTVTARDGRPRWISASIDAVGAGSPNPGDLVVHMTDITLSRAETMLHRKVIGAMAQNASIEEVMTVVCTGVQTVVPDIVATVLALEDDGTVRALAAPGMPTSVSSAFTGLPIGPAAGSCGTAMYRNERVIVTDIAEDPRWADYRDAVLPLGLRACWSTPITAADGRVLGAFAFYDRERRAPDELQLRLIDLCVDLCALALERDRTTRWMHQLTFFDALTGLPNRQAVHEAGERTVLAATRKGLPVTTLVLDIDRFQQVNDVLGRAGADQVLKETATRLRSAIRSGDLVGRLDGDEFVAILPGCGSAEGADLAALISEGLARPIRVDETWVSTDVSVGVSELPDHGDEIETLVRNAELAMRHAKASAPGTVRVFHPDMSVESARRRSLEYALRHGVADGRFVVHYQPQRWARRPDELYGLETLIRLDVDGTGLIPPGAFLGVAEECNLMGELTRFVLDASLAQLADWDVRGVGVPRIAVNISASTFRDPVLARQLDDALVRHGIAPSRVVVEMTESVMLDHSDRTRANLEALHEMGVSLSLDDFGAGYSSLSYLHRLRVDELKLDRSFVQAIDLDERADALITSVLGIAGHLGLTVVAEGVETPHQRDYLVRHDCDVLQGFLLARPLSAADLEDWLTVQHAA